jgi:hypothetical protein
VQSICLSDNDTDDNSLTVTKLAFMKESKFDSELFCIYGLRMCICDFLCVFLKTFYTFRYLSPKGKIEGMDRNI